MSGYADEVLVNNLTSTHGDVINLYAQWNPDANLIRFYPNGSYGIMDNQKVFYQLETTLLPSTFEMDNWSFVGWNTQSDGSGIAYTNEQSVMGTAQLLSLYAQWSHDVYYVQYKSNDPTDQTITASYWVNEEQHLHMSLSRQGYLFQSWNTKPNGTGTTYFADDLVYNLANKNETFVLYAQWEPITYQIIFDANGGTGTMDNQQLITDVPANLATCTFENGTQSFVGWNTNPFGYGIHYENQQEVVNLSLDGEDRVLYAQWRVEMPQTGDHYSPDLWISMVIASVVIGSVMVIRSRRSKQ